MCKVKIVLTLQSCSRFRNNVQEPSTDSLEVSDAAVFVISEGQFQSLRALCSRNFIKVIVTDKASDIDIRRG